MDEHIEEIIKKQVNIYWDVAKEMGLKEGEIAVPTLDSILAVYEEVNHDLRGERMEEIRNKPKLATENQKWRLRKENISFNEASLTLKEASDLIDEAEKKKEKNQGSFHTYQRP